METIKIKYIKSYNEDIIRKQNEVIPGTFDIIFKEVFKSNKEYLADMIYEVTGIPKEEILKGTIINSKYSVININEKRKTSDIIIELNDGVINLEMNNRYYKELNKRNDMYLYKIVSLSDKRISIQININNFKSKDGKTIKRFTLKDEEEKKAYEDKCILEDAIEDGYNSGLNDGISNEKINIAKNLLSMNMALEDISKATGLSIDEIKNLIRN